MVAAVPQGMLGITMVNLIPGIKPTADHPPATGMEATRNVFWASMYFTALGEWQQRQQWQQWQGGGSSAAAVVVAAVTGWWQQWQQQVQWE